MDETETFPQEFNFNLLGGRLPAPSTCTTTSLWRSTEYPRKSLRSYITPSFSVLWPATLSNLRRSLPSPADIYSNWRWFQYSGEPVQSWAFYCQNHHLWGSQVPVDGGGFLQARYLLKNTIACCNMATSTLDTWSNSDMCCGTFHV